MSRNKPLNNRFIKSPESLVTTSEEVRAGFLSIALEKNRVCDPFVEKALEFKAKAVRTTTPEELLSITDVRPFLISASGLSDKSLKHLEEKDINRAIKELIDHLLKDADDAYIDEVIFRYLLIKGDTVGGSMRNKIGELGQERLIRAIFSSMVASNIACDRITKNSTKRDWESVEDLNKVGIESNVRALHWSNCRGKERLLVFNAKIPKVNKNVDLCLFEGGKNEYNGGQIVKQEEKALMFGELKSGIDPAGADEHWKTGNSALNRIRSNYKNIKTSFIGAAIELSMAEEIYKQLENGTLTNASNLTNNNQLDAYCNWLIKL